MHARRLILKNIGPHRHLDLKFEKGIVGIIGPNGAGKSTVLDSICAAHTNDWSDRFEGVKASNVRSGTGENGVASVVYHGEHNDQHYRLLRQLHPKVKSELQIADGAVIRKEAEITAELEKFLGTELGVLAECVFIPQLRLFQFLDRTPAQRARTFSMLCRTYLAEDLWKAAGDLLNKDPEIATVSAVPQSRLQELEEQVGALRGEISSTEEEMDRLRQESGLKKEDLASLQQLIARQQADEAALEELDKVEERVAELEKQQQLAQERIAESRTKRARLDKQVRELKEDAPALRETLRALELSEVEEEQRRQLHTERDALEAAEESDREPLQAAEGVSFLHLQLDELRQLLSNSERDLRDARGRKDQFVKQKLAKCPTCGTEAKSLKAVLQADEELLETLPAVVESLRLAIGGREEYVKKAREWSLRHARREAQLEAIRGRIELLPPAKPNKQEAGVARAQLNQLDRALEELQRVERLLVADETTEQHTVSSLERYAPRLTDLLARRERLESGREGVAQAQRRIEVFERDRNRYKVLQGILKDRQQHLNGQLEQLTEAEEHQAKHHQALEFRQLLEEFRNVVHPQGLPQHVHQAALDSLEDQINEALGLFGSPFAVSTTPDLNLRCQFPSGEPLVAQRLSVGLQIVLAFALRQALMPQELGMLTLDEPTISLDRKNLTYLSESLRRWASQLQGRQQVLIVTHHLELTRVFHQVIELGAQ